MKDGDAFSSFVSNGVSVVGRLAAVGLWGLYAPEMRDLDA